MKNLKFYLEIFFSFLKIGLLTIGGGYAMIPIIQDEIVNKKNWILDEEFIDILSVAQTTPGPIAVNTAVFVGYQISGTIGAIMATLGCVLPSFSIISVIATFFVETKDNIYVKSAMMGVKPAVVALIFSSAINIYRASKLKYSTIPLILIVIFLICVLKITSIILILLGILIGLVSCKKLEGK